MVMSKQTRPGDLARTAACRRPCRKSTGPSRQRHQACGQRAIVTPNPSFNWGRPGHYHNLRGGRSHGGKVTLQCTHMHVDVRRALFCGAKSGLVQSLQGSGLAQRTKPAHAAQCAGYPIGNGPEQSPFINCPFAIGRRPPATQCNQ